MRLEETITETAKGRSLRVPLDHYKRPDKIVASKWFISALLGGAALALVAWLFLGGRIANRQVSPGPVAAVHAGLNSNCQACHVDFRPLRSDAVHLFSLTSTKSQIRKVVDQRCITCHDEPAHHHAAKPDEVPNCSACHRDHRGHAADIIRSPDATCLSCHRDMNSHREGPSALADLVKNVTGFGPAAADGGGPHPPFRSLANDPGNIKFNHWLHLQPGLAAKNSKQKKKLDDLEESHVGRYEKYAKHGKVLQLDCAACHEPDSEGRYMRPIAFEQHCRACHPLQVKLADLQQPLDIPHGLTADKLRVAVDGLVAGAENQRASSAKADESSQEPIIPGRTMGQNLAQQIGGDSPGRRSIAERTIAAKCQQCHYGSADVNNATELLAVRDAKIPQTWLQHATFDHSAHRRFECRNCHSLAYAFEQADKEQFLAASDGAAIARDDEIVMISGLNESCVKCHAPRGEHGGARYDCAECHRYHDRDKIMPRPATGSAHDLTSASLGPAHFVSLNNTPALAGAATCASAGCHGEVKSTAKPWNAAFTTWVALGPHVQSYDVLWTPLGRDMTRLLAASDGKVHEPLTDKEHFQALQERCVGCHATPRPPGAPEAPESYALGVQCESCHGAAGTWLHTHYRQGFTRNQASGMFDSENLNVRAETCMRCHLGPNHDAGHEQVVDHDLIAAGHPRLAFEFHAYLSNLPAHWVPEDDEQRYPGEYHFRSWLAGQKRVAEQRPKLEQGKEWTDFALLDCFACHHQLAADSPRQPAKYDDLRPPQWPPEKLKPALENAPDLPGRLRFARGLLEESRERWDAVLQSYLATRAILRDVKPDPGSLAAQELMNANSAAAKLAAFLAKDCYPAGDGSRRPTQYDSPTLFTADAAGQSIRPLVEVLQRLETAIGRP